jgi:hypothetical protein
MTCDAVCTVNHVHHQYGDKQALNGVDLSVPAGQIVALLGPNGSGKTTLFRLLCTLLPIQQGSIHIGGIDIHAGNSWIIRNNHFRNIASPAKAIAEHAVHVWNNAYNTAVTDNRFEDVDRAIGFGMRHPTRGDPNFVYSHKGGLIKNNLITHRDNHHPFADTGIILEDSPGTVIIGNRIWLEHNYPRAIEYRFSRTRDVMIEGNITNKAIASRNGGTATLRNNNTGASYDEVISGWQTGE